MTLTKDDKDMIPEWAIQGVMEYEANSRGVVNEKDKFQMMEPSAASSLNQLIKGDIQLISQSCAEVFKARPDISNHMFFLLWRSFLRGWHLGEAKWKSDLFALPDETKERNPDNYLPRSEDF